MLYVSSMMVKYLYFCHTFSRLRNRPFFFQRYIIMGHYTDLGTEAVPEIQRQNYRDTVNLRTDHKIHGLSGLVNLIYVAILII